MKTVTLVLTTLIVALTQPKLRAQGTFVYDQQSAATEDYPGDGGDLSSMQVGQSFTPSMTSVGFVDFEFQSLSSQAHGGTVAVNLRQGSISGPILGTSETVLLPEYYSAIANFQYSSAVTLTPGTTYYFQPIMLSGDAEYVVGGSDQYNYGGGTAFFNDVAQPGFDLWFREGIVATPEPSALTLAACATGLAFAFRRTQQKPPAA